MFKQIRSLLPNLTCNWRDRRWRIDEAYIGGKAKNKHLGKRGGPGRSTDDKTPVFGMVERGGRVIARVTTDAKAKTVLPIIAEKVLPKSIIYTDDYVINDNVRWTGQSYEHRRINHTENIYVRGDVPTNSIEGFWSLLKYGIVAVYHSIISTKYLQTYLSQGKKEALRRGPISQVC
jgi:transposase